MHHTGAPKPLRPAACQLSFDRGATAAACRIRGAIALWSFANGGIRACCPQRNCITPAVRPSNKDGGPAELRCEQVLGRYGVGPGVGVNILNKHPDPIPSVCGGDTRTRYRNTQACFVPSSSRVVFVNGHVKSKRRYGM